MAAQSVDGLRLPAALSLAEGDLRMKHRCGTGGPWVCKDGLECARGACAASCHGPERAHITPVSRGHSTIRAKGSQYSVVGIVPFVISVHHDDNRGA